MYLNRYECTMPQVRNCSARIASGQLMDTSAFALGGRCMCTHQMAACVAAILKV